VRVLIIGGTRFMGPHIVRDLVSRGHEIAVFHRGETSSVLPDTVTELFGDRDRLQEFTGKIRGFEPKVVLDMMLLNEKQALTLVEVLSGVARRLVVASSCDVYWNYDLLRGVESGPVKSARVTEDSRLREKIYPYRNEVKDENDRLYNYDKILVERVVMAQSDPIGTALRLPVVYGPGDYRHRFYNYLRRMKDNRPAILIGEQHAQLRITRGYCENCAAAISLAVTEEEAAGRIYNIGEEQSLPERVWIEHLASIVGWQGEIITRPESDLPEHLKSDMQCCHHLDIDTGRVRSELGFKEPVSRETALRRTIDWELDNPPKQVSIETEYEAEDKIIADLKAGGRRDLPEES